MTLTHALIIAAAGLLVSLAVAVVAARFIRAGRKDDE